jgi:5,10-methylenetetrahydromethanopterin reductase
MQTSFPKMIDPMFRLSIAFQGDKTPRDYEALAELVDGYDFDIVSVYNDLLFQPALGPLLLMARNLRRAHLGPAALNPFTVHPVEIAGQAAMLDLVSNGRAYLGLARGAWLDQIGVQQQRPAQTLREAVQVVRHVLACHPTAFEGEVFRIAANTTLNYAPLRANIPIMIGTWGKRTATMAGELADEIKVGGSSNPAMVAVLSPALREGERHAKRPENTVGMCFGAVTVVDEDRAAARAKVRREAALYLPVTAALDPTLNDPEWLARVRALDARKDYAAISGLISDDILDKFAFAGNPTDIIERVAALRDAGATRVEFGTPHGLDSGHGIRLLGEKVLPNISR